MSMQISPQFCLMLALAFLLLPFPWVTAWLFAAVFHELCHYLAIRLLAGKGTRVKLYSYAAHMHLPQMGRGREVLCALAGPAGSLLLLAFSKFFPRIAICGAMQAMYNLIPVYPLDGGRAMQCVLALALSPKWAGRISRIIQSLSIFSVFMLGIYGCVHLRLGLFPLLMALLLCIRLK